MQYQDASATFSSNAGNLDARDDADALAPRDFGPATGNSISGMGTITGAAGADLVGAGATVVALQGASGGSSGNGGSITVQGRYGTLTMEADGTYSYARNPGTPDGVTDVFTYTLANAAGARDSATLTIDIGRDEIGQFPTADQALTTPEGVVVLPAGVQLSDVRVVGRDLVITLPDGSQMVIPGGAVFVPQLVIGDVEVPPANLAALLIDADPKPAAGGPPQSSGGNFAVDVAPLDPGVPLGDLIPPTELTYTPPEFRDSGDLPDHEPEILIQPTGQLAVAAAVDQVFEAALAARGAESEGSGEEAAAGPNGDTREAVTGTIVYESIDTPNVITINGAAVTAVGQVINGAFGTITITSIADGAIGYRYTLGDNTSGDATHDDFTVVITDRDGDQDTATLRVNIVDDTPTARPDTDSVAAGQFGPATGNLVTDAAAGDAGDGDSGADTRGADGARVSFIDNTNNSAAGVTIAAGGTVTIPGQYGSLTVSANGDYSYTRSANTPGGVTENFSYTLLDGDGDTSNSTLTITIGDLPVTVGTNAMVRTDDDAVPGANGIPGGEGDDVDAQNLTGTLSGSGGDGTLTFDLLTSGAPSGFTYVDGPNGSILVQQNGTTVLTITVNATTGAYTVTQNAPILHAAGGAENNSVFTINYTVTDLDGDTGTGSLTINVDDDTPTVNVTMGADREVMLTTQDADTIGSASDTAVSTANFSGVFAMTAAYGADGAGSQSLTYALNVASSVSGLTSHGVAINLYNVGGVVVGSTATSAPASATDASVVFSVSVSATGVVTLTQHQQIDHPAEGPPGATGAPFDDQLVTLADGKITLTATGSITDRDGDTATDSETVDLGGNIRFADHGPSVSSVAVGAAANLDETTAGTPAGFPISDTSDSAVITYSGNFGADGPGTETYGLSLKGGVTSLDSGIQTAIGDRPITLVLVDGDTIEGRYTDSGTQVAFSIQMNADGTITVTQYVPLEHLDDGPPGPAHNDPLDLNDLVNATVTLTDFDGDTATGSAPIGDNIVFRDDGPSVDGTANGESAVTLTTQDGQTIGVASDSDSSSTNFSGVFASTASGGADGTASVSTSYALAVTSSVSGLTSQGAAINLYMVGTTVVGSTAGTAPASLSDASIVFTIAVDSGGTVTLTQHQQIDHAVEGPPGATNAPFDDQLAILADGKVSLTATTTVTDNDGDFATDTATIDLGGNIRFADHGPDVSLAMTGAQIRIDETDGVVAVGGEVDPVGGNLGTVTVTAATLFSPTLTPSADTPTTLSYSLLLSVQGVASGLLLSTTNQPIYLYNVGGVVYGSTSLTAPANGSDPSIVFSVSITSGGDVTVTQFKAVEHLNTASDDEDSPPFADDVLNVQLTATDFDGDTDTAVVDLGSVIVFEDDGPTIDVTKTGEAGVLLTTQDAQTIGSASDQDSTSINFGGVFGLSFTGGSDGAATTPTLSYALSITNSASGLSSGGAPITLYMVGTTIVGSTGAQPLDLNDPSIVFTVAVSTTGVVTVTQLKQIDHSAEGPPGATGAPFDDQLAILANSKIALTATASVTDNDGDTRTDSETIDLGENIRFADDGPTARNDLDAIAPGGTTATGNVITDAHAGDVGDSDLGQDDPGADTPIRVISVDNTKDVAGALTVSSGGFVDIAGQYGTLRIFSNGDYVYTRTAGLGGGQEEVFEYTIQDFDGDTSSATLTIAIDDLTPAAGAVTVKLDDDAKAGGNPGTPLVGDDVDFEVSHTTLPASGGDGALTRSFAPLADQPALPAGFSYGIVDADTLEIKQGSTIVITLQITDPSTGAYTVTQNAPIDHADGNLENNQQFTVNYVVSDVDNDKGTGTITIDVDDDTPTSTDEGTVAAPILVAENAVLTGKFDFSPGADGAALTAINGTTLVFGGPDGWSQWVSLSNGAQIRAQADGDYEFDPATPTSGTPTITGTFTVTDGDNDPITSGFAFKVTDVFTPTSGSSLAKVDDDGLPGANPNDPPSDDNAGTNLDDVNEDEFVGTLQHNFGGDGAGTVLFAPLPASPPTTATVGQETVTYTLNEARTVLTATITASPYDSREGTVLFTVTITDPATGAYRVDLLENVLHPDEVTDTENNVTATINYLVTDADNSVSSPGTLTVDFDDDVPGITTAAADSTLDPNTLQASGAFQFTLGADNYSPTTSPATYLDVDLSGTVDGRTITVTKQPTLTSYDPVTGKATYDFDFTYDDDGDATTAQIANGGTVVFDLDSGGYVVTLDDDFTTTTIIPVSDVISRTGYNTSGSSPSQYEIVVSELNTDVPIFVKFTAISGPSNNTFSAGGNAAFATGETFAGPESWASISNTENGVAGDTIQSTDILNIDFYDSNPVTNPSANVVTADGLTLDLAKLGTGEDLVVLLKLVSASDPTDVTTRAIIVPYSEIYTEGETLPAGYTGTLGNDLGLVVIESNDFNGAGEDYVISGAQMIMSTQNISGSGIVLNGATGAGGGSDTVNLQAFGTTDTATTEPTVDQDVIKIVDIGLITKTTLTQNVQLTFDVTVTDQDGDVATDQFVINPTTTTTTSTMMVSREAVSDDQQLKSMNAANNNSVLLGAIAGAGIVSTELAATETANSEATDTAMPGAESVASDDAGDGGTSSAASSTLLSSSAPEGGNGNSANNSNGNSSNAKKTGLESAEPAQDGQSDVSELSTGNDVPAQAAPAATDVVAMPSAEDLLAAMADAGDGVQSGGAVEKIVADALAGGEAGANVDALLSGLPGNGIGAIAAIESLASHGGDAVPGWDMGAIGGFTLPQPAFSMDSAIQHPDAVQAA